MVESKINNNTGIAKVSPIFHLCCIFLSATIIYLLVLYRLSVFKSYDSVPKFLLITPEKYENFGGFASVIDTGLYINQYDAFDMVNNHFVFSGILWFELDPGTISIATLEKFSFERGKILNISPPDIQFIKDKLLVRYTIRVEFSSSLNNQDFPLEDHSLYLVLEHKLLQPREVVFEAREQGFIVKPEFKDTGWQKVNIGVMTGYKEDQIDELNPEKTRSYPVAIFAIDYSRVATRFVMSILLPLLIIFYLVLFAFSTETKAGINLATGGITAILAYRFVIDRLSPSVGYFMTSDYLFFLILGMSSIAFFLVLIEAYRIRFTLRQKKIAILVLHSIVNAFCFYFLYI